MSADDALLLPRLVVPGIAQWQREQVPDATAGAEEPPPELLWHGLAPFLCDATGNSHRAEINIEKLWNPFLAGRGKQGLVEFRALRMQHTPERATALACLLRSVVATLACADYALPLIDWGRELHERFAFPFYLEQDLDEVLSALAPAGLGLDEAIRSVLLREAFRRWGDVALPGCALEIRRALEFWPLLGDAARPEQGGSFRLVDASTARVELRLRPEPGSESDGHGWQVITAGVALPMRHERDGQCGLQVFGLRYRSFIPPGVCTRSSVSRRRCVWCCAIPATRRTISSPCMNGILTASPIQGSRWTSRRPANAGPSGLPWKSCPVIQPAPNGLRLLMDSAPSAWICAACDAEAKSWRSVRKTLRCAVMIQRGRQGVSQLNRGQREHASLRAACALNGRFPASDSALSPSSWGRLAPAGSSISVAESRHQIR
ncbi:MULTISPECIES: transglutaminase family protein [unclassified Variovorax]|uniref:transglutaminase family protein n=1 Tax=unclassified Variovorax TaxID=663243 RepID=UPI003ECFCDA0